MIPFSELPGGAYYVVPNEIEPKLRRKGGPWSGSAVRAMHEFVPPLQLHLRIDPKDRLHDSSLMVIRVYV